MQAGVILAIVFAILISIFALQNAQPVDIKFLTLEGEASLALVILISVAIGAAILGLLNLYSRLKSGKSMKKLAKEKEEFKRECEQLKNEVESLQTQRAALEGQLIEKTQPVPEIAGEETSDASQESAPENEDVQ